MLLTLVGAGPLIGASACAHSGSSTSRPAADSVQVGYGTQPKGKTTGAVTAFSNETLSSGPLRIEELLRGRIPGLVISGSGNSITFRLRGSNSMLFEQEPLVIVDDVMIQSGNIANALAGFTPEDIKQVSVLKDVASTSIYGSRGGGGVILITTKAKRPDGGELNR